MKNLILSLLLFISSSSAYAMLVCRTPEGTRAGYGENDKGETVIYLEGRGNFKVTAVKGSLIISQKDDFWVVLDQKSKTVNINGELIRLVQCRQSAGE